MIEQQPYTTPSLSSLTRGMSSSVDIIKLLDKLEELVEDAPQLGKRALWLNADDFFLHTNKIRAFLPDELKRASRISRDSEQLMENAQQQVNLTLDQARAEGTRIIEEARRKAAELVAQDEIRRRAGEEAEQILEEARRQAERTRSGADEYAREVLAGLDSFLGKIQGTVQRGRSKLEQKESRLSIR